MITRTFEEVTGKDIKRIHQEPILFSQEEKDVWVQAVKEFHTMRRNYFATTNNARKDAMLWIIQQITLLLRISAAPNTVSEYTGDLPGKLQKAIQLAGSWPNEIVAIGVRHKVVLDAYAAVSRPAAFYRDRRDDYLCETTGLTENAPREWERHFVMYAAELAQLGQLRVRQQGYHPGTAL